MNDKRHGANIHKLSATLTKPGRIQSSSDFQQHPIFHLLARRSIHLLAVTRSCAPGSCRSVELFLLHELDAGLRTAAFGTLNRLLGNRHRHRQIQRERTRSGARHPDRRRCLQSNLSGLLQIQQLPFGKYLLSLQHPRHPVAHRKTCQHAISSVANHSSSRHFILRI